MRSPTAAVICRDGMGTVASRRICSASHTMSAYRTCPSGMVVSSARRVESGRMPRSVARWRIEDRLVRHVRSDCLGHRVVALEDQALGPELTEFLRLLLAAAERIEGVHDVLDLIALKAVKVEVRGVEFRPDAGSALLIPSERRSLITQVASERFHVPCCEGQLQNSRLHPSAQGIAGLPWCLSVISVGWQDGQLMHVTIG